MTDLAPAQPATPRLKYAMLLYPGLTLLDLIGPQAAWGLHGDTHLVWKTKGPVLSDSGVEMVANTTFEDCPYDLDVLFVPGGFGTWDAMEDEDVGDFLRSRGPQAKLITSVCTGSIIL